MTLANIPIIICIAKVILMSSAGVVYAFDECRHEANLRKYMRETHSEYNPFRWSDKSKQLFTAKFKEKSDNKRAIAFTCSIIAYLVLILSVV